MLRGVVASCYQKVPQLHATQFELLNYLFFFCISFYWFGFGLSGKKKLFLDSYLFIFSVDL